MYKHRCHHTQQVLCRTYHCKVDEVQLRQAQQRQRVEHAGEVELQSKKQQNTQQQAKYI